MLLTILPGAAYANGWLMVKLALLVVYIVPGSIALKRNRTRNVRLVSFVAALAEYGSIVAVVRLHHPPGPLRALIR